MLSEDAIAELEKQQYRVVGDNKHSAVKVCGWTKNMIRGKGGCYKLKFYGIMSNQCLQASTSISCANRCTFCWRGYKAPVSKDWKWGVDDPLQIIDQSIDAHHDLLQGFGGSSTVNKVALEQSRTVKHVALSLTGEPITYPRINEAVAEYHKRGISTFMVTNAQYVDQIRNLAPVTQLYLSVDAPNKPLLKEVDVPLFSDYWVRMLGSLDELKKKLGRTTIRLTMIKGVNMVDPLGYADLISRGDPDFVEVKGYMFVGASRQRLSLENMPFHEDVTAFVNDQLLPLLPDYEVASEHKPSRVVLLAKKRFYDSVADRWETWIDFDRFHALFKEYEEGKREDIAADEYSVRFTKRSATQPSSSASSSLPSVDEVTDERDLD